MGALMRAHNWAVTPLGPLEVWPQSLRTAVGMVLGSRFPACLVWGPHLITIYSDAYRPIFGDKPEALGQPFNEVWREAWRQVGPIAERAFAGEATFLEDFPLTVVRNGDPEEAFFTFCYSPVRDETGQVAGFLDTVVETTGKVLTQRRQAFRLALEERVRDLADPVETIAMASEALGRHFGVGQVTYAEVEAGGEFVTIAREWNDGTMASNAGRHWLDDYGPALITDLRQGTTVAIADVRHDPRTSSAEALAAFARASISGLLNVPLVKGGRMVAILGVHSTTPHAWTADEVSLAEEVTARTWDAVERARAEAALRVSEERLQLALGASGMVGLFDWHVPEDRLFPDARFARVFGVDPERAAAGVPLAEFVERMHPEDRPRVKAAIERTVETGEPYEIEYRVLQPGGDARWLLVRGCCLRNEAGEPVRFPGTAVDIHARKLAEERQALLAREVDHRAKNALAVVQAALRLTRAPDLPTYVRAITGRVTALARAQTLLADERWAGADLRTMLAAEMDAFLIGGAGGEARATLLGPTVALPAGAAQPLAMVVHELATNAIKHGALSVPGGRVAVTWSSVGRPSDALRLRWAETGGPAVMASPPRRGFGSRVLEGVVRGQLGGEVSLAWNETGLVCDVTVPLARTAGTSPGDLSAE